MWPFRSARAGEQANGRSRYIFCPDVKASAHPDGVVFLHIRRGMVLSSNRVGARIWQAAGDGKSLNEIAGEISREFGVAEPLARSDAAEFLRELEGAGVLARHGDGER